MPPRIAMLSVIIPVYNERPSLESLLTRVCRALPHVAKQIVIVDDGSTDGTREWLRATFAEDGVATSGIKSDPSGHADSGLLRRRSRHHCACALPRAQPRQGRRAADRLGERSKATSW